MSDALMIEELKGQRNSLADSLANAGVLIMILRQRNVELEKKLKEEGPYRADALTPAA